MKGDVSVTCDITASRLLKNYLRWPLLIKERGVKNGIACLAYVFQRPVSAFAGAQRTPGFYPDPANFMAHTQRRPVAPADSALRSGLLASVNGYLAK
ncbi:hypothetical protein [Pseudomonas sp.]|uniref:hypothetical protein n=1 Tax=Pseudomonas sp. TaxID=306 RepID=UPI003565ADA9